jgi:hypothetical protein
VSDVPTASDIEARLRRVSSLPETLDASFDAFEAIRRAARDCQDRVPELFAAFMMTADAAVDGREALTPAPSLPPTSGAGLGNAMAARANLDQVPDALATLAAVLRDRLTDAAGLADTADDRAACQDAADAARRICQLMTR